MTVPRTHPLMHRNHHGPSKAILLGRQTFEEFAPAWSGRTAEQDPGAPFMNESPKRDAVLVKAHTASCTASGSASVYAES